MTPKILCLVEIRHSVNFSSCVERLEFDDNRYEKS